MNPLYYLLSLSLSFLPLLAANEYPATKEPNIIALYIAPCFGNDSQYACYFKQTPGHAKTILTFENFPVGVPLEYSLKRSILSSTAAYVKKGTLTFFADGSFKDINQNRINVMGIDSIGFLPGESVCLKFESKEGLFSKEIEIVPNRLIAGNDEFFIEAKAVNLFPITIYSITLHGLSNETVKIRSISGDEDMQHELAVTSEKQPILHMPGVLNRKGGVCSFQVTRSDKSTSTLYLPWGSEFSKYVVNNPR